MVGPEKLDKIKTFNKLIWTRTRDLLAYINIHVLWNKIQYNRFGLYRQKITKVNLNIFIKNFRMHTDIRKL
jgi:hypothetical protein